MNILVTGSNGFVGGIIVEYLKQRHHVIGVGTKEKPSHTVDQYIRWDIARDEIDEDLLLDRIDVIIHAAASIDVDDTSLDLSYVNCLGTQRIFNLALKKAVKKVFYISSAPIIGIPVVHPITEGHPVQPNTMYHATKLAGEILLDQLNRHGIENVNLRVSSPIGPGMPVKSILPLFIKKVMTGENVTINGKGTRRQNYIDVRDIAKTIENNFDKNGISGTYLMTSNTTVSNVELAQKCINIIGGSSTIDYTRQSDITDEQMWDYDNTYAKTVLGFKQSYNIDDSIIDIWKAMKSE